MIRLIYVSSATRRLDEDELVFLLNQARSRNERQQVTGLLLHAGGNFIQVLEGSEEDVEAIYHSIQKDERNKGHIVIEKGPISERAFPHWTMGFEDLTPDRKAKVKGYSEFLNREMKPDEILNNADYLVSILYEFKKNI